MPTEHKTSRGPVYFLLAVLAVIVGGSIWGAWVSAKQEKFLAALEDAEEHASDGDNTAPQRRKIDAVFEQALKDPQFSGLSQAEQARAYLGAGWAAVRNDDYVRARERLLRATGPEGVAQSWYLLAQVESRLEHHDAASRALATYLQRYPRKLDDSENVILRAVSKTKPGEPGHLALLQTLYDLKWTTLDPRSSEPWLKLALARLQRGETQAARAAVKRIDQASTLVSLRGDKRFDGLYDPASPAFDPVAAAGKRVETMRDAVKAQSSSLQAIDELSRALIAVGRDEEVLPLTEELANLPQPKDGDEDFEWDDPDKLPWVKNQRADALMHVGRVEDGLALLRDAAASSEDGGRNVSQVLNLAGAYCDLGRAPEALAAANGAGEMNGHGKMVQHRIRHCAALLSGDSTAAAQAMAYLREHREDSDYIYMSALMHQGDLDGAAKVLIDALADEEKRNDALFWVQDFSDSRLQTPLRQLMDQRWEAIMARPEVVAAIDKVGRRAHYDYHEE
jgi:tetratricopeptide (TPR) repeat protein